MTFDPSAVGNDATLTASGIARLAKVSRAAVSNWRRRHADFPPPVGGTASNPVFDAVAVEQWLRRQGKLHQASAAERAWRLIEGFQPATQIGDALCIAGCYLLARSTQPASARSAVLSPKQLASSLRRLDRGLADTMAGLLPQQWSPALTTLLTAVQGLSEEDASAEAFEYLHTQYVTSASSISGAAATPDAVSDVMACLLRAPTDVIDFACGTGSILRTAMVQQKAASKRSLCMGQEIKAEYALIALLRLWFVHQDGLQAGRAATAPVVKIGDSLLDDAFPDVKADAVVMNPPFGIHDWGQERLAYDPRWTYGLPPRTEPELAWVQHALAHLTPGGTAVILMPPAAAQRPAGRRIRAELVRRGALQAVIALPAGLMPPTGVGLHLWVLTQPHEGSAGRLLVVDTTTQRSSLVETVRAAWQAFATGKGPEERPGVYRVVSAIDVLDEQVDLSPQRYLPQPSRTPSDPATRQKLIQDFERLIEEARTGIPVRSGADTDWTSAPEAEIAALIRSGTMSLHSEMSPGERPDGAIRSKVQAGDILVSRVGTHIAARIAATNDVGTDLVAGTQALRVNPDQYDVWFVAHMLARSENVKRGSRSRASSSTRLRLDVRRLTIPVVPLQQQRTLGSAFREIADFRALVDGIAEAGALLASELAAELLPQQAKSTSLAE